ncbi:tetratricopeptide repeat protein [Sphingomonas flavalba]|uniref:tetratricopeptide repeat protein n=1 Tax=Sphingomonas flavalba TaxID=2559804 RepID=UPI0039DFE208
MTDSLTLDALNGMDAAEISRRLSASAPPEARAAFVAAAAESGVTEAQLVYGQMLLDGAGVAADPAAALRWFARAAENGHVMAINMVGRCYDLGWGVAIDKARAAEWYYAAALRGLDWGMYNYATLLTLGAGVAEDKAAALGWFRRAAAMGNAKAWNFVGSFHEDGWVVEKDMKEAARCYAIAARGSDFRGQFNHARLEAAKGRIANALEWFARSAESCNPRFAGQAAGWLKAADPRLAPAIAAFEAAR